MDLNTIFIFEGDKTLNAFSNKGEDHPEYLASSCYFSKVVNIRQYEEKQLLHYHPEYLINSCDFGGFLFTPSNRDDFEESFHHYRSRL